MAVGSGPTSSSGRDPDGREPAAPLEDARSATAVERLLEESWGMRDRMVGRRESIVEGLAAALFLACAVPLAVGAVAAHGVDVPLAAWLVLCYAVASGLIKFPIGAGYFVPSYLVLVPMLLLLPPGLVPLLTATGLVLGTAVRIAAGRVEPGRVMSSIADAWHSLGPALVLIILSPSGGGPRTAAVYVAAFSAGCLFDLVSALIRDAAALGIRSGVQLRVLSLVWLLDACTAPLGLLIAHAARSQPAQLLLLFPFFVVLLLVSRERDARIEQAQMRLDMIGRERSRLQIAVRRLGEALSARLDLDGLTRIVLRGSMDALDADAGYMSLTGPADGPVVELAGERLFEPVLRAAEDCAHADGAPCQVERSGVWALALPFTIRRDVGHAEGVVAVAREGRAFRDDEQEVMGDLVERAREAAGEIIAHRVLREQARTDALTTLGNRRKLADDMACGLAGATEDHPLALLLFDLDGFKHYNDTFGHLAGDALLARLGQKLSRAVHERGSAYRLGGDEFCALVSADAGDIEGVVAAAAAALQERGENFAVGSSCGAVLLPGEATNAEYALQLADERMYASKRGRGSSAGDQMRDVLVNIIQARRPGLSDRASEVCRLAMMVGRRLSLGAEQLDELRRAAELHDIGKVGIPDAILEKPGPLTLAEWEFVRQHAVLGERILGAAPAMRPIAAIVRSTHERWDGTGYPDGLAGDEIPLASRIVCACDAWEAMTSGRTYREPTDADRARDELRRESGRQFDPAVVEILLEESARAAQPPAEEAALFPAGDAQHGGVGHVAGLGGGDAAGDRGDGDGGAGGHRERL